MHKHRQYTHAHTRAHAHTLAYQCVLHCISYVFLLHSEVEIPTGRRIGFNGREDFTISLLFNRPNIDLLVSEISRITVWCEPFNAFFGELNNIPAVSLPVSYIKHKLMM